MRAIWSPGFRRANNPGYPRYHGYVLFSTTGKWVVSIAVKSQRVGSFVVNVTSG